MPTPRIRHSARVVLLDQRDRVLLFKADYAGVLDSTDKRPPGPAWITPGGGLDPGEIHETAALRELEEETGITDAELLQPIWTRDREYLIRYEPVSIRERFFLARVVDPILSFDGHTEVERASFLEARWWYLADLAESSDLFVPRDLPALLEPILAGDLSSSPIPVGR